MESNSSTIRRRLLHWVYKVKNLKSFLKKLHSELGLKVLRHEEFNTICEATCNGNFDNAWSKTMAALGDEKQHFALELVYNYAKKGPYRKHFGMDTLAFLDPDSVGVRDFQIENYSFLKMGPDYHLNYRKVMRSEAVPTDAPRFQFLVLNVADLERSVDYYTKVLGMQIFSGPQTECPKGILLLEKMPNDFTSSLDPEFLQRNKKKFCIVGYAPEQTLIKLVESGQPILHDEDSGRMAFTCVTPVTQIKARVDKVKDTIKHQPVVLKTEGKADVKVIILQDRDDYEICFVEESGFHDLCTTKEGDDQIDWQQRQKLTSMIQSGN